MNIISIGFKLLAHQGEIKRLWTLLSPVVTEARKAAPELWPLAQTLAVALGVMEEQKPAEALASFNTRWLQRSLKRLGSPDLLVDGKYGDATTAAVKRFQTTHPPLAPDGWAGVQTCATIAIEIEKLNGADQ